MIFVGTYIGIAMALVLIGYIAYTIRWQRRFGGFWPYSVLLVLLLGFVVLATVTYSVTFSDASLEATLKHGDWKADSIDALRPRIAASNASQIICVCTVFLVLATLILAFTYLKALRLERKRAASDRDTDAKA